MGEEEKKETPPVEESKKEEPKKEAPAPPPKRLVIFELTADGFKLVKNDCVSMLEFRGLLISVLDALNRK